MTFNNKYEMFKVLNQGIYGTLFEVIEKSKNKKHYALKLFIKSYHQYIKKK